ncbi:MAG: LysE family translocator [Zoogloeaceae bacterium]|nr:LysE family translocator [Zoogloeaceae bacterium]
MIPPDVLATYLLAAILVVVAPGPDNLLAISRGLCQGWRAAALSALGAGLGIMTHTVAAAFGLQLVLQTSPIAFGLVKAAGGAYLLWLGYQAFVARRLITVSPGQQHPLGRVFLTGLLSNVLNPKPGLFVAAFIPQFVAESRGPVAVQILVYGAIFALLTTVVFSFMGAWAGRLKAWMTQRPRAVAAANRGAGIAFIAAGLSILTLERRH